MEIHPLFYLLYAFFCIGIAGGLSFLYLMGSTEKKLYASDYDQEAIDLKNQKSKKYLPLAAVFLIFTFLPTIPSMLGWIVFVH